MEDPSCGLFGAFGSWLPYQTVLFDEKKEAVSEYSERNGASPIRIKDCVTAESMIRHLTVLGMVESSYGEEICRLNEEIRQLNEELKENYKLLIELEKRISDIYCRRDAINDSDSSMSAKVMNRMISLWDDVLSLK